MESPKVVSVNTVEGRGCAWVPPAMAASSRPKRRRRSTGQVMRHGAVALRPALSAAIDGWRQRVGAGLPIMRPMRFLHTMLRVGDLQRSIDFYTRVLGMKLLRTTERPEQKYSLAFVGYGSNPEQAEIELTYNHGVSEYELGTAFGHLAIGVTDA